MADELPYRDKEAEHSVLGSILRDATYRCRDKALAIACQRLTPEDFYETTHRRTFEIMTAMHAEGLAVDVTTLGPRIRATDIFDNDEPEEMFAFLEDLGEFPSAAHVEYYVAQVASASARRRLVTACESAILRSADPTEELADTVAALVKDANEAVAGMAPISAEFDLPAALDQVRVLLTDENEAARLWTTGLTFLDELVGGFAAGQYWVVAGRSQHGKTAMAVNMMLGTLEAGGTAVMFRYEENVTAVLLRLASLLCNIPYSDVHLRTLSDADTKRFDNTLHRMRGDFAGRLHIFVGTRPAQVEQIVATLKPWLVVYDTLQAMAAQVGGKHVGRHDLNVGDICALVARLALTPGNEHAAVLLSQLKKGTLGIPTMGQLRESGAIEEAPDVVCLNWWPTVEKGDSTWANGYTVKIGKNRITGRRPLIVCRVNPATQRFKDAMPKEEADDFMATTK